MTGTWSAPGKLLLFGEHAAVFGYPALGVPLHARLVVTVREADRWSITLHAPGSEALAIEHDGRATAFLERVHATADALGFTRNHACAITFDSDIPVGGGFGSSAALCSALARWMHDASGASLNDHALWETAHSLEMHFHGTPSGIDTGITTMDRPLLFRFDGGSLPTAQAVALSPMWLVAGSIPRRESTMTLVASVRRRREEHPAETEPLLAALGSLSLACASGSDARATAQLADEGHALLAQLGVTTAELDSVIAVGRRAGALGAKVSGAGGGGAFYCVCDEPGRADHVARALEAVGTSGTIRVVPVGVAQP